MNNDIYFGALKYYFSKIIVENEFENVTVNRAFLRVAYATAKRRALVYVNETIRANEKSFVMR